MTRSWSDAARVTRYSLLATALLIACARESPAPPPPKPQRVEVTPKPVEAAAPAIPKAEPIVRDLDAIREVGSLRVLFTFNSTGYLVFRGETMGYEYELLSRFAGAQKLKLVPVVVRDSATLLELLNRGEGDVVAAQLVAPTNESEVKVTDGLYETAAVVVQRGKASPAAGHSQATTTAIAREERETGEAPVTIRARLVERPSELAGQNVHLSRRSPYRSTLLELNDSLTDDVHVVEVDESADRLIQRLSEGEIGYTVAAENVAQLKATEYTNLIVQPALGPPRQVVWAVRRNAPQLHDALNEWLRAERKKGLLNVLYRKYFLDRRGFAQRAASRYLTAETGTLSPYDDWFREYARIPGWDWRLVASQAYQESRFNANAKSWAGATGLMQIMPRTARELRVNPRDPRQSIEGACRYLWKFDDHFKEAVPREEERIRFILASYNVGLGHVEDARRLAKKYGDDPGAWKDVAYWLIRKSKRSVYNDPVVKYGFARGTEPVDYVERILDRFEHYKAFVDEDVALLLRRRVPLSVEVRQRSSPRMSPVRRLHRFAASLCARSDIAGTQRHFSARVMEALEDPQTLSFEECERRVRSELAANGVPFGSGEHHAALQYRPLDAVVRRVLDPTIQADPALAERLAPHGLDASVISAELEKQ